MLTATTGRAVSGDFLPQPERRAESRIRESVIDFRAMDVMDRAMHCQLAIVSRIYIIRREPENQSILWYIL
jgi:hypothetical protein